MTLVTQILWGRTTHVSFKSNYYYYSKLYFLFSPIANNGFPFSFHLIWPRGVDVNKRTEMTHLYSLLQGIRFGRSMTSYVYFLSFIGHIVD